MYNIYTMNQEDIKVPEFNGNVVKYMQDMEEYTVLIKKEKYNIILEFINRWLKLCDDTSYKSLLSFKNVTKEEMNCNITHNRKILAEYKSIFNTKFRIEYKKTDCIEDVLKKLLQKIDYQLVEDNELYCIKMM